MCIKVTGGGDSQNGRAITYGIEPPAACFFIHVVDVDGGVGGARVGPDSPRNIR